MRPEVNSNRFKISLRDKISLRCEVTFKLTEVKFQTAVSFPCKQQMLAVI